MAYGTSVTIDRPFDEAVTAVREALAEQGFGVLTEIDVQATMKQKLDHDMEPYLILGACNPPLAKRGLDAEISLGLLLPCNVVVRSAGDRTVVEVLDPQTMVRLTDNDQLKPVADEAAARLAATLDALQQGTFDPSR
ncbi:MAG: DUF302 domain-containing protein [Actinomycetota bacterium]